MYAAVNKKKKNVLSNCRWPMKITVKIRAFFEKMAEGIPETKFCYFKIFF
jgi:hypothetical protein